MSSNNLQHIIDSNLRWIFVGGKGGVGKTTTSSSLAIQIAHKNSLTNDKTLILSTDPAHNLSDAFSQQFTDTPTAVNSVPNLFAMEINPTKKFKNENAAEQNAAFQPIMNLFAQSSMPGMDELMSFVEVMDIATQNTYKTVIFDTAPTGHTLRFLEIPQTAKQMKTIFTSMKQMMGPMLQMMGGEAGDMDKVTAVFDQCDEVEQQFKDPNMTQFVCVCIPEFLSLYETERLVQQLMRLDIDCGSVVVNQVLDCQNDCGFCRARSKMQSKYITQMKELYEDFALVFMSLGETEVRGIDELEAFGQKLKNGGFM
ncbi:Arsenical pump-driving ATPase [Spironucleus salmonicida]|uniref:Arsenical pump-driving ATPase n=1 Tax=Spironucleus salmonicida TaxID=348837 RepID=V6LK67_9EUKA|nr:Arsenical pump-driving ATPase [Spironucleus salmonicida]|eukprot:EST44718.1 Arsenical pump-driving ATPase [Spironucleus salmonicida]